MTQSFLFYNTISYVLLLFSSMKLCFIGLALLTGTVTDPEEQAVTMSRALSGFAIGEGSQYPYSNI